jgi:hypothetical protein
MSFEVEVYDTLKRNRLMLAPDVVKIVKELGYNDIQNLVQIESPDHWKKTLKTFFLNVKFIK